MTLHMYEWRYYGYNLLVTAKKRDGEIYLTMTGGKDSDYAVGDTWLWQNSEKQFYNVWEPIRPIVPSVWMNIIRWHDGTVSFSYESPHYTEADALAAFDAEPFDEDGNPCELIDTVEVRYPL